MRGCGFQKSSNTLRGRIVNSIHNRSPRRGRPYVAVNCAAVPENLLEGMPFGTSKGAFTGAIGQGNMITEALAACGGNAAAAARRLGISPQLMHYKLKRFGIDRRRFRNPSRK